MTGNPEVKRTWFSSQTPVGPYLATLLREMPWKVASALGLMISLSLMEGIGLLMLVPLLQVVGLDVQQGTTGRIAQFISSVFTAAGVSPTLLTVLGVYVLITSLHALLQRLQSAASLGLNHEFVVMLRQRLYRAIAYANWLLFVRSRASDFSHVLTHEVERVGAATYQLLHLFATGIVTVVYLLFALKLSIVMTGLVSVCGGTMLVLMRKKTRIARVAGEGTSKATNQLYAAIAEHVGGMKAAKAYGVEARHVEEFERLTQRVHRTYVRAIRNQAQVKHWFDVGSVFVLCFIAYVSVEILSITTAELLILLFLFARIMPRFSSIQQGYQSFVHFLPAFSSVMEMQARCEAGAEPTSRTAEDVQVRRSIHVTNVSFAYDESLVIRDLDLTIRAGETTALVGPSGAGKTTVADMVIGLIAPLKGRVLVDGAPLAPERMRAWRDRIGYVAQDTFLFHDTVRANALRARREADDEEIWGVLRLAAADAFVSRLPNGLDTVVGDRGVRLSGGERQRLALAGALLRKPSLLILDEATSNLDAENERCILRAIERLHGLMTILIISHRLSMVRGADVIYVMEEGRLVASETWDALIAKKDGRLWELCLAQGIEF